VVDDGVGVVLLERGGDALKGEVVCGLGVRVCVVLGDHGQESQGIEAEAAVCFDGKGGEVVSAVFGSFLALRLLGRMAGDDCG